MNHLYCLALEGLSLKEWEQGVVVKRAMENKIKVLTEEQKANHRLQMKMFGRIINY